MAWPESLDIALKEWASVCHALENGKQTLLLRKGGVSEVGGEFHIDDREFLLFPTYIHQNLQMLKPAAHDDFEVRSEEPKQIRLTAAGVVTDILRVQSREQIEKLDGEHIWTKPLIDMRFNYKPEKPLYLMVVRAYRLAQPVTIENTFAYAGCKSWVPLDVEVKFTATPAIADEVFEERRQRILRSEKE
jgi:hypothetical protein